MFNDIFHSHIDLTQGIIFTPKVNPPFVPSPYVPFSPSSFDAPLLFKQGAKLISNLIHSFTTIINKIKKCFFELILLIEQLKIYIPKTPLFSATKRLLIILKTKISGEKFLHKKIEKEEVKKLFFNNFDYSELEIKILKSKHDILVFNYYGYESYKKLKDIYKTSISTEQISLNNIDTGIRVYQTIVNLYVQRFLTRHPDMNHPTYLPCLRLAALRIAIKDSIDGFNQFERLNKFLPSTINAKKALQIEQCFLREIEYNISLRELVKEDE